MFRTRDGRPRLGWHASHEQLPPSRLLAHLVAAERAGFDAAMCSDHLAPWTRAQGNSGFSFAWLGAALQATSLPLGTICAPAPRYHPAVVAQAAATLAEMYPGRFWLALGSGERLNEHVTGEPWPPKPERNARLAEGYAAVRDLLAGREVTRRGRVRLEGARVWVRPERPPPLLGAAVTEATARFLAPWAGGLLCVTRPDGGHARVVRAFREAGGEGKPVVLQAKVAWAEDEDAALAAAFEQWRANVLPAERLETLATPEAFEAAAADVTPEDVARHVRVSSDLDRHARWILDDLALGVDAVLLHQVPRAQERVLEAFGRSVLPAVRDAA